MMGQLFIMIIFIIVFGTIIVRAISGLKTWNENNQSAVLSVEAVIVTKRDHTSRHTHNNMDMHHHTSTSTTYYVTFEVESGDRMEFRVPSKEYGVLVEGDKGKLTFQGTRYLEFQRYR